MKICNICEKEIKGYGNNPWPICDKEDTLSYCCDECNINYIIPARLLLSKNNDNKFNIGDEITIFWLHDEPRVREYIFRKGTIENIDSMGQLHGTWGTFCIDPEKNTICKI